MNRTTKICVVYGTIFLIVGTALEPVFAGQAFLGSSNQGLLIAIAIALRWPLISVGAALIGAGVVVQALTRADDRESFHEAE